MKKVRKSIVYQRCEDIAAIMVSQGYSNVTSRDLEYLLKRYVGADPRTVRAYKRYLIEFNFLALKGEFYTILKDSIPVQKVLEIEEKERGR
jgi:hypothetical protein